MTQRNLPPGFRFTPTEEELISFYLQNKLDGRRPDMERVVPVADMYTSDPWQLPGISGEACIQESGEWFFFCPRQQREAHGGRPTRTTPSGYWKATGSPSSVYSNNRAIGMKRTMVFYLGRAPSGTKTKWKLNEYKAFEEDHATVSSATTTPKLRSEFSVCRVYNKSGCLRSFDRRPPGEAITSNHNPGGASSSHGNSSLAGRVSSHDSSSSGDQDQAGRAADWEMPEAIDWDALDLP